MLYKDKGAILPAPTEMIIARVSDLKKDFMSEHRMKPRWYKLATNCPSRGTAGVFRTELPTDFKGLTQTLPGGLGSGHGAPIRFNVVAKPNDNQIAIWNIFEAMLR